MDKILTIIFFYCCVLFLRKPALREMWRLALLTSFWQMLDCHFGPLSFLDYWFGKNLELQISLLVWGWSITTAPFHTHLRGDAFPSSGSAKFQGKLGHCCNFPPYRHYRVTMPKHPPFAYCRVSNRACSFKWHFLVGKLLPKVKQLRCHRFWLPLNL